MDEIRSYFVNEFLQDYREKRTTRRAMLRRITLVLGGATAAAAWLQAHGEPASAREAITATKFLVPSEQTSTGVTVNPADPDLRVGAAEYPSRDGATLVGYLAEPAWASESSRVPGVLLIHANGGLQEHYRDVARRYAKEGFAALAVDLLAREGGTGSFPDQPAASAALSAAGASRHLIDMHSGIDFLVQRPEVVPSGVAATGFCFGGGMTWHIAVEDPRVVVAAPFYGSAPPLDRVPKMQAAVLGVYAEDDARINRTLPALEDALASSGKTFMLKIYPGTSHSFFSDTGSRYSPDQAPIAWADTLAWFRQYGPTA